MLGRAISGVTSANMAVATAYITDISTEEERPKRFGLFHATFGIGFIIGPVLGGHSRRLSGCARRSLRRLALNGINLMLALFVSPRIATAGKAMHEILPRRAEPVQAAQMGADLQGIWCR